MVKVLYRVLVYLALYPTLVMGEALPHSLVQSLPVKRQPVLTISEAVRYPPALPDDMGAYVQVLAKEHELTLLSQQMDNQPVYAFPIATPSMQVGTVNTMRLDKPLFPYPLFLIGSDTGSLKWLKQHKDTLKKINAVGWLIEAATEHDMKAITQQAEDIVILPLSAETVADVLPVKHYPMLIEHNTVWQKSHE